MRQRDAARRHSHPRLGQQRPRQHGLGQRHGQRKSAAQLQHRVHRGQAQPRSALRPTLRLTHQRIGKARRLDQLPQRLRRLARFNITHRLRRALRREQLAHGVRQKVIR